MEIHVNVSVSKKIFCNNSEARNQREEKPRSAREEVEHEQQQEFSTRFVELFRKILMYLHTQSHTTEGIYYFFCKSIKQNKKTAEDINIFVNVSSFKGAL